MTSSRDGRERDARGQGRSGGLRIAPRFAIATTVALAVVLGVFGFVLAQATREIVTNSVTESRDQAALSLSEFEDGNSAYEQLDKKAKMVNNNVLAGRVRFTKGEREGEEGVAYVKSNANNRLLQLAPISYGSGDPLEKLYGLFFALTLLVLIVAALVSLGVATRVSKPINSLVDDVRSIASGHLDHRVRTRGGGEVALLGNAIDRMSESLREARDAEVELGIREREREVAMEVQDALRPTDLPRPVGYSIASEHVGSAEPGGDFHDVVVADDGRVILFVCDVSGTGVPGALVGAMARAYIKSRFKAGGSLDDALKDINRSMAGDVRRGMYVTLLAAALDPEGHEMEVASAGHKLPLVHWSASENAIRAIQPDGIALGFDKGPVFDRGVSVRRLPMSPGDRVALAGTGAVRVIDEKGAEIGEKRFYKLFARNASDEPEVALDGVLTALEAFADEEPFPADVSLIVLGRDEA